MLLRIAFGSRIMSCPATIAVPLVGGCTVILENKPARFRR
jgi:hypothetical protein